MRRAGWLVVVGVLLPCVLARLAAGQDTSSAPATHALATDQQRLGDFIALIEGPNLPVEARRLGARNLLRQGWPETEARLAVILAGQNAPAKVAVAQALADVPGSLAKSYIDPLLAMLADPEADVRRAAAAALAGYRDGGVAPRLRALMLDHAEPLPHRLAAIEALGLMPTREAMAALVEALDEPSAPICPPALRALEQATAKSFRDDPGEAQAWWKESEALPLAEWQQAQIDRLVQKARELSRRLREVEGRLVEAFRADYIRAPEAERLGLAQSYLADSSTLVRLLGLDLVQRHLGEGKKLAPELTTVVRTLLSDGEPDVRAAAVQAVARLREASDADRFLELLARERHVKVRTALVNGLGYVGGAGVVEPLVALVRNRDDPALTEAVAALGRLAERGVLSEGQRDKVAEALLTAFRNAPATQVALRERVLWAMSLLAEARFGNVFVAALSETEAATVRQAAARGLAALRDPQHCDALLPLMKDPELTLRRAAVEAVAELASRDEQLAAIWSRLDPAQELEEAIRRAAWRGASRLLAGRPVAEQEQWLARLPRDGALGEQHALELLQMIEATLAHAPNARGELGRIRARLAAQCGVLDQPDEALATYLAALGDLHAARSPETDPVAAELLRFALVHDRYDEAVASALAAENPPLDGAAVWQVIRRDIDARLTPDGAGLAIRMLEALKARPPTIFPREVVEAIHELLQRARAIQATAPTSSAPASQPQG